MVLLNRPYEKYSELMREQDFLFRNAKNKKGEKELKKGKEKLQRKINKLEFVLAFSPCVTCRSRLFGRIYIDTSDKTFGVQQNV